MSTRSERPYASVPSVTPLAIPGSFSGGSGSNPTAARTDSIGRCSSSGAPTKSRKPPFRPAADDTKPVLSDPISRPDEQAMLRPAAAASHAMLGPGSAFCGLIF